MPSPGITKHMLADAMKALMAKKPLSKISVGDLVQMCNLNRNSFYYHFKDKYDLVNWIFYADFMVQLGAEEVERDWDLIDRLCHFFYDNRQFYLHALETPDPNPFWQYVCEIVRDAMMAESSEQDDAAFVDFYTTFWVDAFLMSLYRWLKAGAQLSPDEMSAMLKKTTTNAAAKVIHMD